MEKNKQKKGGNDAFTNARPPYGGRAESVATDSAQNKRVGYHAWGCSRNCDRTLVLRKHRMSPQEKRVTLIFILLMLALGVLLGVASFFWPLDWWPLS